jgi:hypothetical protein
MKKIVLKLFSAGVILANCSAVATTHYVDLNCTNATPPYTDWATAATNIQDAVDAAVAGDEVVVTNGVYNSGFRTNNAGSSRVVVEKPLTVRSVNGPEVTTIRGGGGLYIRCVMLANDASLSGFTLANGGAGGTAGGGGLFCASGAVASNCVIVGNIAVFRGGGASGGTLVNCAVSGNAAGTYFGLHVPVVDGGGAYGCTLVNCTLTTNKATSYVATARGGGAYGGEMQGCLLVGNSVEAPQTMDPAAGGLGGGAIYSSLWNCTLVGNSASAGYSGAVDLSTLNNCTLVGNVVGARNSVLNNCIAYFNDLNCDAESTETYCCTIPQPTSGAGNITNAPLFMDTNGWTNLRLQSNSPCINAGDNTVAPAGLDLDGNPRIVGGTVDIGAYEYQSLSLINFGVVSNQAGFSITGQSNQVVIVETSTDLLNWSPLATNTSNGHPFPFNDPTPATLPQRFYRAQAQ